MEAGWFFTGNSKNQLRNLVKEVAEVECELLREWGPWGQQMREMFTHTYFSPEISPKQVDENPDRTFFGGVFPKHGINPAGQAGSPDQSYLSSSSYKSLKPPTEMHTCTPGTSWSCFEEC